MKADLNLLIVDDNDDDIELCEEALSEDPNHHWIISTTDNGKDAINLTNSRHFDCMLLDYSLPALNGVEVLDRLRARNIEIPVIMLTGQGSERVAVEAMKYGAQDYLTKSEIQFPQIVDIIMQGISRKRRELDLFQRANYDHLTGLASRSLYYERLNNIIERSKRTNEPFALMFMDLDKFKRVNDTYGHQAGDSLLKEVGNRLESSVRKSDTVARLGGDEFAIILERLSSTKERFANKIMQKIHTSVTGRPIFYQGNCLEFGVSIGCAIYPDSGTTQEALEQVADRAMYDCKADSTLAFKLGIQ